MRKYQELWIKLKEDKHLIITLEIVGLTTVQKTRQLRTIRRAVQKEKYRDYEYKYSRPFAEITTELNNTKGTLEFTLNLDTRAVSHLF